MKFVSNLFYTDIDLCKPKVIQGIELYINLYLLILLTLFYLKGTRMPYPLFIFKYLQNY